MDQIQNQNQNQGDDDKKNDPLGQRPEEQNIEIPSIEGVLQDISDVIPNHITYGANGVEKNVAGMTVGQVAESLASELSLTMDPSIEIFINGQQADAQTVLKVSDRLEFIRDAGQKGTI